MATSIEDSISKYIKCKKASEKIGIVDGMVSNLITDSIPLLKVVELLSDTLTDTNVEVRLNGTSLLSELMHRYKPGAMSDLEVQTFMAFYCDRLKDHHSIQPIVLYGFLGLLSYQQTDDLTIIKMLKSIFTEVHVQSLIQSDRRNVFNLFNNLLKSHIEPLKKFENDFVLGFIQSMDGERDPRNLLVCFENAKLLIEHLDITVFQEDLFEVLSCYFPVDFTPPKNNPFNITKEDLVIALRGCLTMTPKFAEYAIPLFVEKMTSDVEDAKLDAVVTFSMCLENYDSEHVEQFISDIWLSIRKDYLLSDMSKLSENHYLNFISKLFSCLVKSKNEDSLSSLTDLFIKDCKQTLKDPELTIAEPCAHIIEVLSDLSIDLNTKISSEIIPIIQNGFQRYTSTKQQYHMVYILAKLLTNNIDQNNTVLMNFMGEFVSHAFEILKTKSSEVRLYIVTLKLLKEIIKHNNILSNIDFNILEDTLLDTIFSQTFNADILTTFKIVIGQLFDTFADELYTKFTSKLESSKDNNLIFMQNISFLECCKNTLIMDKVCLDLTNTLIANSTYSESVLSRLIETLANILKDNTTIGNDVTICENIIKVLFTLDSPTADLLNKILLPINYALRKLSKDNFATCLPVLHDFVLSSPDQYNALIEKYFKVNQNIIEDTCMRPVITFCMAIVSQCHIEELKIDSLELVTFFVNCQQTCDEYVVLTSALCVGIILNKMKLCKNSHVVDYVYQYLTSNVNEDLIFPQVSTLISVCRALILHWQSSTTKFIQLLIEYLCNEKTGESTANEMQSLFTLPETIFDSRSYAVTKLLYKQRFIQFILPIIVEKYHEVDDIVKARLIKAISVVLKIAPKQMLATNVASLLPLLMHSLSTTSVPEILQSTLSTLSSAITMDQSLMESYVTSLVPRLLEISTNEKMSVRILALKCLRSITRYPPYLVTQLRNLVLRGLVSVLDDKKRLVRKEAIACKNSWHLLSTE